VRKSTPVVVLRVRGIGRLRKVARSALRGEPGFRSRYVLSREARVYIGEYKQDPKHQGARYIWVRTWNYEQ
jgi:hypothetical protein